MKKLVPIIIVVLIIIAGAGYFLTQSDKSKDSATVTPSSKTETKNFSPPNACDVLTLEDAKKVLGEAEKTDLVVNSSASSDDISVSQCNYNQPGGDNQTMKQVSILVSGAKTKKGAESHQEVFTGFLKPAGAQDVSGYGDSAFWDPALGQFNVLKNGNRYVITSGVSRPAERTLDEAKALADIIKNKL